MRRARFLLCLVLLATVLVSCSSDSAQAEPDATSCQEAAQSVLDRFDEFLEPYQDQTPEQFLASPELDGLESFQNDVAQLIVDVANDPNDDCTESDLEREVDLALQNYAGDGLLNQYVVGAVRGGLDVEQRDIRVGPDDDLLNLLPLLGPGSSVTFAEGTYQLDATLLVQSDLLLVGAGIDRTVIESTADSAAVAVIGGGRLVVNDLSIEHVGEVPASVALVIDSSIELVEVGLRGGVVDADGAGGSGLVLSEVERRDGVQVAVDRVVIRDNAAAGVAVTGSFEATVLNSTIERNEQCGICYFDDAAGQVQNTTLQANGVGIQTSGRSAPEISRGRFLDNLVAGLLVEDEATPVVVDNHFQGAETVGIDVQGAAAPVVQRNTFGPHAVAMSLRGSSTAATTANEIDGGDIGILVGGTAAPSVVEDRVGNTDVSALLVGDEAGGEFIGLILEPAQGAGVVVEGHATPLLSGLSVEGGLGGAVFRAQAGGRLIDSTLADQQVGVEVSEDAAPVIDANVIARSGDAGAIVSGSGEVTLSNNTFDAPAAIGMQTGGSAEAVLRGNTVDGGDTGVLVTEASRPTISDNVLQDQNFGIGISGTAEPEIDGNRIVASRAAAISFEGSAAGTVTDNVIVDANLVGIRLAGTASPLLESNALFAALGSDDDTAGGSTDGDSEAGSTDNSTGDGTTDEAAPGGADSSEAGGAADAGAADAGAADAGAIGAGLLFADSATGAATDNEVFGFVIGVQVSDAASPTIESNHVDGAGVGGVGILYGGNGSGTATGNLSINQQLGFQLSGDTTPTLGENRIENASVAAMLLQGATRAVLEANECATVAAGIVLLEDAAPELVDNDCPVVR